MLPKAASLPIPAFANTISSRPFCCLICANRRSRSARFDTSPCTPGPLRPIASTAAANSDSRRPVTNTYAPSSTNRFAVASPMPLLPPVMRAIFPSSLFMLFSLVRRFSFRLAVPADVDTSGRSEGVHLVAGRSDVGDAIRQLRLRHRQRVEGFAQQFDLAGLRHQVSGEQVMGGSPGRGGARVRPVLGEGLFRRLDQDACIVRRECEVRIDFQQLANQRGDLAAAGVASFDPERTQERQFEHPVIREQRCGALRIAYRGEIIQQQSFGVFHVPVPACCHTEPSTRATSTWSRSLRMRRTCCRSPRAKGTEIECDCPGCSTDEKRTMACFSASPLPPITVSTVVTTCQPSDLLTQ